MLNEVKCHKGVKKIIALLIFCVFVGNISANAQLLNKLKKRAEDRAKSRVEQKINNKVDETTDKTVDKTIEVVTTPGSGKSTSDTATTPKPTKADKKKDAATNKPAVVTNPTATTSTAIKGYPRKAINFNNTTPINVPNAWGPYKDAEGNRYGFHKGYDMYKVSPDGITTLYFSNKENKNPFYTEGVMDKDANFYFPVMERNGRGIVKLTKNGELQHLAGNGDTYYIIADGQGASAKINQVDKMKYLQDGNIYFTEELDKEKTKMEGYTGELNFPESGRPTIIRKLTPDGELSTLKDKNNNIFIASNITDFIMDKDGNIVYSSGYIYKMVPGGEITKLLGTPDPFGGYGEASGPNKQRWVMGDVSKAKVPFPDKLFYNAKNELIIWSSVVKRFAKFDGKTVTAFSGTNDMSCFNKNICGGVDVKADKDGTANTAQYKIIKNIVVEGDDIFIITYEVYDLGYFDRALSVRKISNDGSVKTIMTTTTDIFFKK
jgi:hypothetical protein